MRKLSKFELSLVSQMTDKDWSGNLNIPNLLDGDLQGLRIKILRKEKEVKILFEIEQTTPKDNESRRIITRVGEINEIIISTVNLINLLEKEGYIILFESSNQIENEIIFGRGAINKPSVGYLFPDNRTSELLVKYSTPQIIITPELLEFRRMNYKTREEVRHEQNIRLAWIGILVAIFATVLSLIFNIYDSFSKNDEEKCKCPQSIDCICNSLLEIKAELKVSNEFIIKYQNEKSAKDSINLKNLKKKISKH